jgi:hypothetical protein
LFGLLSEIVQFIDLLLYELFRPLRCTSRIPYNQKRSQRDQDASGDNPSKRNIRKVKGSANAKPNANQNPMNDKDFIQVNGNLLHKTHHSAGSEEDINRMADGQYGTYEE